MPNDSKQEGTLNSRLQACKHAKAQTYWPWIKNTNRKRNSRYKFRKKKVGRKLIDAWTDKPTKLTRQYIRNPRSRSSSDSQKAIEKESMEKSMYLLHSIAIGGKQSVPDPFNEPLLAHESLERRKYPCNRKCETLKWHYWFYFIYWEMQFTQPLPMSRNCY